ncbi:MAG: ABC transporter substrate-binding protein, partial [Clostridia bacterium]|nr:ABC transporter substrate-binding protein [Clostridia bacterium]
TEAANILPDTENIKVVSLQDAAAAVYPERTFESGERDPHIWLSPKRVEEMIKVIAKEMCAVDPGNTDAYNSNADDYIEQLDSLDQYIKNELSGVHDGKFIVYHPAFGYFADDYGLTMYALEEEGKEATPQHLQDIIDLAVEENIKVVFYQDEIDSRQSEAFAEEIGGNTMELSPLAADYIINLKSMADLIAETVK